MLVVQATTPSETVLMFHAALYATNLVTTLKLAQKHEDAVFVTVEITTLETAP